MTAFDVIFFDLGSTLLYSKDPWPPYYEQGDRALVDILLRAGIRVDPVPFYVEFQNTLDTYSG